MKKIYCFFATMSLLLSCSTDDVVKDEMENGVIMEDGTIIGTEIPGNTWDKETWKYNNPFDRPSDTYTYPFKMESDEYKELEKEGENAVWAALEIPETALKDMSTAGIIQSLIEYPLLSEFANHQSMAYTVDYIKNMNLGQELITRKDAGEWVLRYWLNVPAELLENWETPLYFGYLVSIPEVAKSMTTSQKQNFISYALKTHHEKTDNEHNIYSNPQTYYMIGKLLQSEGYQPMLTMIEEDNFLEAYLNVLYKGSTEPVNLCNIHMLANNFLLYK